MLEKDVCFLPAQHLVLSTQWVSVMASVAEARGFLLC